MGSRMSRQLVLSRACCAPCHAALRVPQYALLVQNVLRHGRIYPLCCGRTVLLRAEADRARRMVRALVKASQDLMVISTCGQSNSMKDYKAAYVFSAVKAEARVMPLTSLQRPQACLPAGGTSHMMLLATTAQFSMMQLKATVI